MSKNFREIIYGVEFCNNRTDTALSQLRSLVEGLKVKGDGTGFEFTKQLARNEAIDDVLKLME